jgi:hypothetical protein
MEPGIITHLAPVSSLIFEQADGIFQRRKLYSKTWLKIPQPLFDCSVGKMIGCTSEIDTNRSSKLKIKSVLFSPTNSLLTRVGTEG